MSNSITHTAKVFLPTSNGINSFWIDDIMCFESFNIYSYVHYQGKKVFCGISLKKLELILDPKHFYRCHKSIIVNISNITTIPKGTKNQLTMSSGINVPFSRRKNIALWDHFKQHTSFINGNKNLSKHGTGIIIQS